MKKILFLGHSATRSGAPVFLLNLLRWFREQGEYAVELALTDGGPLLDDYRSTCPTLLFDLPSEPDAGRGLRAALRARSTDRALRRAVARLDDRPADLIYANTITLGRLTAAIRRGDTPVITHVHEMAHWIERSGTANLDRVRSATTRFVAASRAVRDELAGRFGIDESAIEVVHEFVPWPRRDLPPTRDAARRRLGVDRDAFLVVGSGHETWRKGKDLFVRLAAELRARPDAPAATFLWLGGWDSEEARRATAALVEELAVGDVVRFAGEVPSAAEDFAAADVFAMVSREDPFPLVCLEAAAMAVPVVCFAGAGGAPELVEGDAGRVVGHLDVPAMAAAIADLARDPEARGRLGRRAAEKVRERHTIETGAPRIRGVIEAVLAAGRG